MIPTSHGPYSSPQALNRALTDLLRARARHWPGVTLDSLRRQFAYDRLLTRVFTSPDAQRWVLKGATAMLARLAGDARHTRDIDLYRQEADPLTAEKALRAHQVMTCGSPVVLGSVSQDHHRRTHVHQNIRRGHYELGVDEAATLHVAAAFDELTLAI